MDDVRTVQVDAATRYIYGERNWWKLDIKSCLFYARWFGGKK
jgi:hypothetical protein